MLFGGEEPQTLPNSGTPSTIARMGLESQFVMDNAVLESVIHAWSLPKAVEGELISEFRETQAHWTDTKYNL